jgi:hypothetical protein
LRMVHGKHNSMSTHHFLNLLCSTRAPEPHQHWCYFTIIMLTSCGTTRNRWKRFKFILMKFLQSCKV